MEDEVDSKNDIIEKQIKEQSQIIFKYRDLLKKNLKKNELQDLLEYNKQELPVGHEVVIYFFL